MKAKDIAKEHGFDRAVFEDWLKKSPYPYRLGGMGALVLDEGQPLAEIVTAFRQYDTERRERLAREHAEAALRERERQLESQRAAREKQQALDAILMTSGSTFDGYTVTRYAGYISGDDATEVDRGTVGLFGGGSTNVGASLMASLKVLRRNALAELREAAYALGCNAVIGLDFDYLTLDPETANSSGGTTYLPYVFVVTANGNAVVIEKKERKPLL
jgi:uncharacterized protein YbjQ (UPF0145 family)